MGSDENGDGHDNERQDMDATKGELLLGRARTVVARSEGTKARVVAVLHCAYSRERACQNFKAGRQMT